MFKKKFTDFEQWYASPVKTKDRVVSALLGIWAGLWTGIILYLFFSPMAFLNGVYLTLGIMLACLLLGVIFPKKSRIVFIPFAFFRGSIN